MHQPAHRAARSNAISALNGIRLALPCGCHGQRSCYSLCHLLFCTPIVFCFVFFGRGLFNVAEHYEMARPLKIFGIGMLLLLIAVKTSQTIGSYQERHVYDRGTLLSLRNINAVETQLSADLPMELQRPPRTSGRDEDGGKPRRQRRRRGRPGGVRKRLRRRGNKPPLPSLILVNARSLRNKMDELKLYTRNCNEYRKSCHGGYGIMATSRHSQLTC